MENKFFRFLLYFFRDILPKEVIPFLGGLLFFWAFCTMGVIVAYLVCRGWLIVFTGDVDFLPSLALLPGWLFPVSGVFLMFLSFFCRGWRDK